MDSFAIDDFVGACLDAVRGEGHGGQAVREVLDRTLSRPSRIEAAVGQPTDIPLFATWHRSDELTILHVVWPPSVDLFPHDHQMWATIGLYGGREDNAFFRRRPDERLDPSGTTTLGTGDTVVLGRETVHAVANPSTEWTAAIHCYGGDYFGVPRSMWPDADGPSESFDVRRLSRVLEDAAERARS